MNANVAFPALALAAVLASAVIVQAGLNPYKDGDVQGGMQVGEP